MTGEGNTLIYIMLAVGIVIAIVELGRLWLHAVRGAAGGERGISTHKLVWWWLRSKVQRPSCRFCGLANTPIWNGRCEVCEEEGERHDA